MTETEIPQLHFTRDHIMAMTQLLNMLSQRLAEQRERRGRAAYSNAEHAARLADTHEHPVVRPMSEAERQTFTTQAGDPLVPQHGLSVATAPVGQEWGARAVTPDRDAATVMCPNITEAARLADYLRAQNNPGLVNELNELSAQIGHRIATETSPAAAQSATEAAATPSQQDPSPVDLTKREGLVDLATSVPTSLTATPEWERIEAQFADLTDRGVSPTALAAGVDGLDFDRARRPDARTLRGDDVVGKFGGEEDIDREEAAATQDAAVAEHRGRQSDAASEIEQARDHKVTAQFTPTRSATATAPRRGTARISPTVPTPTQARARGRSR